MSTCLSFWPSLIIRCFHVISPKTQINIQTDLTHIIHEWYVPGSVQKFMRLMGIAKHQKYKISNLRLK